MVRRPCCKEEGIKKGAWTPEEDQKLIAYLRQNGEGGWRALPEKAGLARCGKSCRSSFMLLKATGQMSIRCTVLYFEYGGYYLEGDGFTWISKEKETHTLVLRKCMDEVTYTEVVDAIRKKMMVDEAVNRIRISYIPLVAELKFPTYITGDDEIYGYLVHVDKDQRRSILHVEEDNEDVEAINRCEQELEVGDNQEGVELSMDLNDGGIMEHNANDGDTMEHNANDDWCLDPNANDGLVICYEDEAGPSSANYEMLSNGINVLEEEAPFNVNDVAEDTQLEEDEDYHCQNREWDDGMGLRIGQEFETKEDVRFVVEKAAHRNCFEFDIIKSEPKLYVVKCSEREGRHRCKWALRAARVNNSMNFSVRTYNSMHTCSRSTTTMGRNRRKGTPQLVASILRADYPGRLDTPRPKSLIPLVQGKLGVKVSYATAWRGRQLAACEVRGGPEESYMTIHSYMYMLEQKNPGTVTHIELDKENRFKYLFFALGAYTKGFESMRKVLIVDATHLKTAYEGVLIIATAQDPDHHHFPVAFGVVDGENNLSWRWFFEKLKGVVPDVPELVFLSDINQSLIKAVHEVYPHSCHGFCSYHLSQNMKAHVPNIHKESAVAKFRECVKAYTRVEFDKLYDEFREMYPAAADYLHRSVDKSRWARSYFPGDRYNIDTSNQVESINGAFVEYRKFALQPMIDKILDKVIEWATKHRRTAAEESYGRKLVPFVEKELHNNMPEAKTLKVDELNGYFGEYCVTGNDGKKYFVDLQTRSCSCERFDKEKYPCLHGIAAAIIPRETEIPLWTLCSKYYLIENWSHGYMRTTYPVPHKKHWVIPDDIQKLVAIPPDHDIKQGRTQTTRYPSVGEKGKRPGSKKPVS